MEVVILKNEAFEILSVSTGYSQKVLEEIIFKRLIENDLMMRDIPDCGKSLQEIGELSRLNVMDLSEVVFPEGIKNPEVIELFDSIYFVAEGETDPCPNCGCQLKRETDGDMKSEWDDVTCSNDECEYETTQKV